MHDDPLPAPTRLTPLGPLDPATYLRHPLHAPERAWVDKNCYVDIWIEVLHALGLEPLAVMGFVVTLDFIGDQWTFFKPPHDALREFYGIEVEELNVWQPLLDHAVEHLGAGRLISTEADSYWLPDTAGTDYRQHHGKTTIVLADLDPAAQRLGYFHNSGYYMLEGEDFRRLFAVGVPPATSLPFFAEWIGFERRRRRDTADLQARAAALIGQRLPWRPADNPVRRFARRLQQDLPLLQQKGLAHYHAWAFGTVRQLGAAGECLALTLQWMAAADARWAAAAPAFQRIGAGAKTAILKLARAVSNGRSLDAAALFDECAAAWEDGMAALDELAARPPAA